MQTIDLNIPSLSCSACAKKITEGLKSIKGIDDVSSDLKSQIVTVKYNPSDIQPQEIKKQVWNMGFDVMQ
jgi:Cu+-exporting ATPase